MRRISLSAIILQITILQASFWKDTDGSVLPRPNFNMERTTTHLFSLAKNYSDEAVVIVTSSELPKQIPPPPTPTKSNGVTPQYGTLWEFKAKHTSAPFHVPYNNLESAIAFQKVV